MPKWLLIFAIVPPWLVVGWLIANLGGWKKLAAHYQRDIYGDVHWKRWRSVTLGTANYNGSMNIGIARDYLYLQPMMLFRFAHPALGIPWRDVTLTQERVWFFTIHNLTFAKCPGLKMRISERVAKALPIYSKSSVS